MANRITDVTELLQTAEMIATNVTTSRLAAPLVAKTASGCLGLIANQRGDISSAAEQYGNLKSAVGTLLGPRGLISTDRLLGLLSQTMGNLNQAAVHFEDALAFCRKAGYRPELAWTCCDYAGMLLERDAEGDRTKAVSLLDESLTISSELGMRPLMERVLARREILKA